MKNYHLQWIQKAIEDLTVVEHELSFPANEIPTGAVCFHAQQCVEKLLKAFLVYHNQEFGRTHNIEFLIQLCSEIDKDFAHLPSGDLSFYAVEVRYPDDFYTPSIEEAQECYSLAITVKKFVFEKLKLPDKFP
ncbi:HEPN domain protein [Caldithrix abyssi DSM 13497]|uniref:HEPN domain protein n=1 Tax=Caldithrix abyssi DSM 13497 TaxID=880073 RepID=H1XUP0_CALAY|nr:HEPN domain-containing protein [Caldithrix abyssi]APF16800.1 HEPN domain-containing protein [Caldithrix abyssi DSM 13497]EHO40539.1 HEPN domain protein [Caldithrix abyssi DSM 13497]